MRCAKHDVETAVSCGRCETPVCPSCMVHGDVGVRCRSCAGDAAGKPLFASGGKRTLIIGAAIFFAIIAVGTIGSSLQHTNSDASSSAGDDDGDGTYVQADVTVSQVIDPWTATDGTAAVPAGRRYIAMEVVMVNKSAEDSDAYSYSTASYFKLKDTDGFVYKPVAEGGATPELAAVYLNGGEKTRGWITFEVDARAYVSSLDYSDTAVALP